MIFNDRLDAAVALFFLGATSTKMFALVLAVGMISGTYSSIFLASPLLVQVNNISKNKLKSGTN